jgi:hypothetical protein
VNTKIKPLDTVRLKDKPEIVFGVRKIDRLPLSKRKGLFIWCQYNKGQHIVPYSDVELVREGPQHRRRK